jgi:uroporphyrinogen-III synthase
MKVCSFESRRGEEMRSLIERNGGHATIAPSMREIPLDQNPAAFAFAEKLFAGEIDVVVFMTGVGARALLEALQTKYEPARFFEALAPCTIAVRGPKPVVVLREWGVRIDLKAPEPNTWRELLETLQHGNAIQGKRIAIQEYGQPNQLFYDAITAGGASMLAVPVYRWELPEDTAPLEAAVHATIAGQFDVLMFTSAQQLHHVQLVADRLGLKEAWRDAALKTFIASIGPTATETIEAEGLRADFEPSHPKMGTLVKEALAAYTSKRT